MVMKAVQIAGCLCGAGVRAAEGQHVPMGACACSARTCSRGHEGEPYTPMALRLQRSFEACQSTGMYWHADCRPCCTLFMVPSNLK